MLEPSSLLYRILSKFKTDPIDELSDPRILEATLEAIESCLYTTLKDLNLS